MDRPQEQTGWLVKVYGWATELLYRSLAWAYDLVAWLVSFGEWARWRRDGLDYLQPGSILEVGFGTGELLIEMACRGLDVIGLEVSPQMHRVVKRKLNRHHVTIQRIRGRGEAIPFPANSFDNLIVTFPSNYIVKDETLGEFFRVLKAHGKVIVAGLTIKFTQGWKRTLTAWFLEDTTGRFTMLLADKAKSAGFRVKVVSHQGRDYTQPIMIMEKPHDD